MARLFCLDRHGDAAKAADVSTRCRGFLQCCDVGRRKLVRRRNRLPCVRITKASRIETPRVPSMVDVNEDAVVRQPAQAVCRAESALDGM